ncbi:MAG: chromate efflux transporter [Thermogutta sp.]|uniref:chromate efflux transporter n=1 Tax=Thermogutta sp. TaxID=1962930 RepID=UPI0019B002CC|nr:chromate efflux transporter [Thermogutta sp.]MBC7352704.1 chromate efflux transporter [Thermogutta sp.]
MVLRQLAEILWVFALLGLASFGGPAASIAIMQQTLVRRRRWLSDTEFMDYVGASHLIPGPIAVQLSLHLGYRRAGLLGALAAVVGFVVPAAMITWLCAVVYVRNQGLPALEACLSTVRPVILGIILVSIKQIAQGRWRRPTNLVILAAVVAAYMWGANPFAVLVAGTFLGMLLFHVIQPKKENSPPGDRPPEVPASRHTFPFIGGMTAAGTSALITQMSPLQLFLVFAKVGVFLYGGGNVLAAYLASEFVNTGILSHQQLLDALAVGQSTPGPILTVATFLGYVLGGHIGAVAATAGIITPCMVLASVLHPYVRKARSYRWSAAFLDALMLAVIGLILGVCVDLGRQVFTQPVAIVLGLFTLWAAGVWKISPVRLILAAALLGLLIGR